MRNIQIKRYLKKKWSEHRSTLFLKMLNFITLQVSDWNKVVETNKEWTLKKNISRSRIEIIFSCENSILFSYQLHNCFVLLLFFVYFILHLLERIEIFICSTQTDCEISRNCFFLFRKYSNWQFKT